MSLTDINSVLLERVLVRLYQDVANINNQIQRVQTDVQALLTAGQLSAEDASFILSKVPQTTDPSAVRDPLDTISVDSPSPVAPTPTYHPSIPSISPITTSAASNEKRRRPVPPPPPPSNPVENTFFQARVIWDYNVNNEHSDDLTLYVGDVIEVETASTKENADWWRGKVRGQTGLFPSSYVERIVHSLPPVPDPAPKIRHSSRPGSEVSAPTYTPYRSTHVAMNSSGGGPNALGLVSPSPEETKKKKGKHDHLKSTMATSAASGVGFGAGAALASGLVRAIF